MRRTPILRFPRPAWVHRLICTHLTRSPRLAQVAAFASARGVTTRATLGYLITWAIVIGTSRFSITALGLRLSPPGSSPLDTVAVMFLLLPTPILTACLTSKTPTLEATRSRRVAAAQATWVVCVIGVGIASVCAATATLHPAINKHTFISAWLITFGVVLLLSAVVSPMVAALGAFTMLALFSTPSLLPWSDNLIYNIDLGPTATATGVTLIIVAAALQFARLCR